MKKFLLFFLVNVSIAFAFTKVETGLDVFFSDGIYKNLKGKKIGLITNQTGRDSEGNTTISLFQNHASGYSLVALFSPEHGINGTSYAGEKVSSKIDTLPIYSLHGKNKRPTKKMLKGLDILVYDIQDIGSRSYTFITTLFYVMEEAAKNKIEVIVLDRPNPMGGNIVDGPMLHEKWRSFIGYVNVPYCHGMTVGELAKFFNEEYKIKCKLKVIPMKGWKRHMTYKDTNLMWIPPSPHIPEADTTFFYPATGILGELKLVNIGVGYTLPFKVVGAPWIDADIFAKKLNGQKIQGVKFLPIHFRPQYGPYKSEDCHGVMIHITDVAKYRPLSVQYMLLGMLKSLYPKVFQSKLEMSKDCLRMFCQANGTDEVYNILKNEKYVAWKLIQREKKERDEFSQKRKKYLISQYER